MSIDLVFTDLQLTELKCICIYKPNESLIKAFDTLSASNSRERHERNRFVQRISKDLS